MGDKLSAPFPYFGGKSAIADVVWRALGDVKTYIEPFFGSGAVLLNRPNYDPQRHYEVVNDADGLLVNVWRAIKLHPDDVYKWLDWMPSQIDLHMRRRRLMLEEQRIYDLLATDEEACDPKLAAYWIYCASLWIGGKMLTDNRAKLTGSACEDVRRMKRPQILHSMGLRGLTIPEVMRPRGADGRTLRGAQIPEVMRTCGVEKRTLRAAGEGDPLHDLLVRLSERLRYVKVINRDWRTVCDINWYKNKKSIGFFLDPPYSESAERAPNIYTIDDLTVANRVREWCIENGDRPEYRIVLAGYYKEHEELINHGWKVYRWKANGGYGNQGNGKGKANSHREALFFSPHCLPVEQAGLFGDAQS